MNTRAIENNELPLPPDRTQINTNNIVKIAKQKLDIQTAFKNMVTFSMDDPLGNTKNCLIPITIYQALNECTEEEVSRFKELFLKKKFYRQAIGIYTANYKISEITIEMFDKFNS